MVLVLVSGCPWMGEIVSGFSVIKGVDNESWPGKISGIEVIIESTGGFCVPESRESPSCEKVYGLVRNSNVINCLTIYKL